MSLGTAGETWQFHTKRPEGGTAIPQGYDRLGRGLLGWRACSGSRLSLEKVDPGPRLVLDREACLGGYVAPDECEWLYVRPISLGELLGSEPPWEMSSDGG